MITSDTAVFLTLVQVTEFCEGSEGEKLYHDPFRPTKQNGMCGIHGIQSVWELINQHTDFQNLLPLDLDNSPDPEFLILQPEEGRILMVLDTSTSMKTNHTSNHTSVIPRITRLKDVARNMVTNTFNTGSEVGVIHFR